jgi:hypothetical protein
MLSIVIPSRNEKFLKKTIEDVLEKATGEVEVFPVLDGYDIPNEEIVVDPRVEYVSLEKNAFTQKRHGINKVINELSSGEYVMSLDAHCMMAPGFDTQLAKDHEPNWVQIPRRHRLDADNWCLQPQSDNRPPIDYEYMMFPLRYHPMTGSPQKPREPGKEHEPALHGFKWDSRTLERWDIPIDDTMQFQGSCWFMTKDWFKKNGFMQIEGYTGWGQEAEEIGLTTWKNGGRVVTNKNTWYAHLHKGAQHGRMYYMSKRWITECNNFSYDFWVRKNKEFFISYINKFWPVPNWPENWQELLYAENNDKK